jgi:hypothetical protein
LNSFSNSLELSAVILLDTPWFISVFAAVSAVRSFIAYSDVYRVKVSITVSI